MPTFNEKTQDMDGPDIPAVNLYVDDKSLCFLAGVTTEDADKAYFSRTRKAMAVESLRLTVPQVPSCP